MKHLPAPKPVHKKEVLTAAEILRRTATMPGVPWFRGDGFKGVPMTCARDTGPVIKSRGPFRDGESVADSFNIN